MTKDGQELWFSNSGQRNPNGAIRTGNYAPGKNGRCWISPSDTLQSLLLVFDDVGPTGRFSSDPSEVKLYACPVRCVR